MARTPSRVEYFTYIDQVFVRTKQAKTMRKLIQEHIARYELGQDDRLHGVVITNIETGDETFVYMSPSHTNDEMDERLAKGKAEVDR